MRVLVLAVGRQKDDLWTEAEAEYRKRLPRYADVDLRSVKDEKALVAALPARSRLVVLDERGELLSSDELARGVLERAQRDAVDLVFAIGGPEGHSEEVRKRAWRKVAFGRITLPHRMCRVLLLEQIYRGFTILKGEPYHK